MRYTEKTCKDMLAILYPYASYVYGYEQDASRTCLAHQQAGTIVKNAVVYPAVTCHIDAGINDREYTAINITAQDKEILCKITEAGMKIYYDTLPDCSVAALTKYAQNTGLDIVA